MSKRWTGVARLFDRVTQETDTRGDPELLEAFLRHDDAEAFAKLVRRHGPMVQGVCRRVLGVVHAHDVDDAFQATFLVLLRRAPSLQWRERLGPWLHGVAHRTALRARSRRARNQAVERSTDTMIAEPSTTVTPRPDGVDCLDEELLALPAKYRQPLVLCELQGLSRREAARTLKLPEGTLSSRLARGRQMLRGRLVRRGVTLSGAGLLLLLAEEAQAEVPLTLMSHTLRIVRAVQHGANLGGASASVLSLTEGVVKSMFLTKLKTLGVVAVLLVMLGGFAGTLATAWGQDVSPVAQATPPTAATHTPTLLPAPARPEEHFLITLKAMSQERGEKSKCLANPTLVTTSSRPASFQIGGELPVPVGAGQVRTLQMIPYGTRLTLTLDRLDQERVQLQFDASFDELDKAEGFDYRVSGSHCKFMKAMRFSKAETIPLKKHSDGTTALWVELSVEPVAAAAPQPAPISPVTAITTRPAVVANLPVLPPTPAVMPAATQPTLTVQPTLVKQYLIEAKIQEAAKPKEVPQTLSVPRIMALEGQVGSIEVGNAADGALSLLTDVRALDSGRVELHVRYTSLKRDKANDRDVCLFGSTADVRTKVGLQKPVTTIFTVHPDGSPRVWAEMTITEAPPVSIPMIPSPPMLRDVPLVRPAQPATAPRPNPTSELPSTVPDAGSVPVLSNIPLVGQIFTKHSKEPQLELHHRPTSDGSRIQLQCGNVRLEATQIAFGTGERQHRMQVAPNGILVEGPGMTTVSSDLVLSGKEVQFNTKQGKLLIVHDGKSSPPVADVTWGDARIKCTKLQIDKDVQLVVQADDLQFTRGDTVVRGTKIEVHLDDKQVKVTGAASVQEKK